MKRKLMQSVLVLGVLVLWMLPALAADAPKVANVIAVKVKAGQGDAYLEKVKKLNGIMKRLDTGGTMRVWRATQAGDSAGMLYIVIEYPNLEAFAKGTTKSSGDDEWTKLVREIDASGMRELAGNSLMVEATP